MCSAGVASETRRRWRAGSPSRWSDIWDNGYTGAGRKLVFLVTIGLAAFGYLRALRSGGATVLALFPVLYAVPVMLWPANQGTRFLIPLLPFYLYYCLLGIRGLVSALAPRRHVPRDHGPRWFEPGGRLSRALRFPLPAGVRPGDGEPNARRLSHR